MPVTNFDFLKTKKLYAHLIVVCWFSFVLFNYYLPYLWSEMLDNQLRMLMEQVVRECQIPVLDTTLVIDNLPPVSLAATPFLLN